MCDVTLGNRPCVALAKAAALTSLSDICDVSMVKTAATAKAKDHRSEQIAKTARCNGSF